MACCLEHGQLAVAQSHTRVMDSPTTAPMDDSSVHIRDARPADRDFILRLVPELHAFGSLPSWRDPAQMDSVDVQVIGDALEGRNPSASILVAEDSEGNSLGFIHLCEEQDYYGGACGHIGDVIVAPAAQGRGVGKALLAAAEKWASKRGYQLLTLNVFLGNERARALYEELEFHPETVRHVKKLG